MPVIIIDYGMSNLGSVYRSLEVCGAEPVVSKKPDDLRTATHIILPGVGTFEDGMTNLQKGGWISTLREEVLINKIPCLGICLGMQMLASKGYEGTETEGLNLIPGVVQKLTTLENERLPHIGWNEVYPTREHFLFHNIENGTDFYFVHSYHFIPQYNENILATTPYSNNLVSAVSYKNIIGTQFHPEKSQTAGLRVIKNFLESS